jgi:hypothetical protein
MEKRFSILLGVLLILVGGLALLFSLGGAVLGWSILAPWRLWPLVVLGVGLLFVVPPFTVRGKRGLGGLFIPGMPILATGGLLFIGSIFRWWGVWAYFWPMVVLGVALGFLLAALYMRVIWLVIPGIIIGATGLLFQFCALTHLWGVWSVLWTIEPFSVGLALLVCWVKTRSRGLFWAGLILCGIAASFAILMAAIMHWWLIGVLGPAVLILVGALIILRGLGPRPAQPTATAATGGESPS